jgi:hypothetical protein
MIRKYNLEKTDETYLRIFQKINFGKEFLEPKFFEENKIGESNTSYRLNVYQYDPNTRLFCLNDDLYLVTSDEAVYNYLDTGRAVSFYGNSHYGHTDLPTFYIYNDLIITDKEIIDFEDYKDKKNLTPKVLAETDTEKIYLLFKEDLDKIKTRLAEIRAEEERIRIEKAEEKVEEKIDDTQEQERLISLIRQYDKMTLLEDTGAIIKDNYFIDKDTGFKVEFKDKVVKLFEKDDLINENIYDGKFISIDYRGFLDKLERVYSVRKYEEPLENKLKTLHKKLLNFKIYSYDKETKAEVFLKEIKIENNVSSKGKLRFKINGIKMPKQKINNVLSFISGYGYSVGQATIIERLINLEKYLEQIRLYSGTQLELLQGKTLEISLNGIRIPIHFTIKAEDKDHWEISIDDYSVKKNYTDVKSAFHYLSGGGLIAISQICNDLKAGEQLENILIDKVKGYVEKRRLAEDKAEKLFKEFLEKNKTKVFKKEGGYIVKGKLKNYIVKMKNEDDVGVSTYPGNEYICINQKTKDGSYLCKHDKLLQFCAVMLNDNLMREEISTIH